MSPVGPLLPLLCPTACYNVPFNFFGRIGAILGLFTTICINETNLRNPILLRKSFFLKAANSLQEKNPLVEFIQTQQEFNQRVLERLEASEKRQVERNQNLMIAIRETQEVKKQLAATQQKRWWNFW